MRLPGKFFRTVIVIFILAIYSLFLARKINFFVADLGRFLKTGELFFQNFSIPCTNLYSYTHPDYPYLNHHWGSGVIFFLNEKLAGFYGLSVFFIIISILTLLLFFHIAWRYSSFEIAAPLSVILIPLIASRSEIRPEVFSYFFSGLFLWVLWNFKYARLSWRWLFLLPLLEVIWVNVHIYFFTGLVLIASFLTECLVTFCVRKSKEEFNRIKTLSLSLILALAATFLNPAGITGILYPFRIMRDSGCSVLELQPVYVIARDKSINFLPLIYFKVALALLLFSWLYVFVSWIKKKESFPIANFILSLFFAIMAFLAVRNFTIFALFTLPIAAGNLRTLIRKKTDTFRDYCLVGSLVALISINMFFANPEYWPKLSSLGIGLNKESANAINFFKKADIKGPILNNFDIGGYLIYHLYPSERVFVDNRPEAYPASFFRDIDIGLQVNEERWLEVDLRYNFNVIFFYHRVYTPWGQRFLVRRLSDPRWAVVYFDEYCLILLKRNIRNQAAIKKYELPKGPADIKSLLTQ